jgi:hypothetical protein
VQAFMQFVTSQATVIAEAAKIVPLTAEQQAEAEGALAQ